MLGFATKADLKKLRKELREDIETKVLRLSSSQQSTDSPGVLKKILEQVNPREFLENLLLSKGLTIEALVRASVMEILKEQGKDFLDDSVTDRVYDDLDMDRIYEGVADNMAKILLKEHKDDLIEEVAEKIADSVHENLDNDEFYPVLAEKVISRLTAPQS